MPLYLELLDLGLLIGALVAVLAWFCTSNQAAEQSLAALFWGLLGAIAVLTLSWALGGWEWFWWGGLALACTSSLRFRQA